jgi:hypothetical protein
LPAQSVDDHDEDPEGSRGQSSASVINEHEPRKALCAGIRTRASLASVTAGKAFVIGVKVKALETTSTSISRTIPAVVRELDLAADANVVLSFNFIFEALAASINVELISGAFGDLTSPINFLEPILAYGTNLTIVFIAL